MKKQGDIPHADRSPTQRAFEILEIVAQRGSVSIAEIIETTGIPRTTAHRIINNLEEYGYILKMHTQGRYVVAPRLIRLAGHTLCAASTLAPVRAVLTDVARLVTGTSSVAVLQVGEVVCIDSVVADVFLRLKFPSGRRYPLYCTSSGKVFLAGMNLGSNKIG